MNVINTIDLAQKLQARTSLSERDATGIIQTVAEAVEGATSSLVTRDQLDARFAELRADVRTDIAKLETKIAELKADIQVALRSQMTTIIGSMAAIGGLIVAFVKLL